MLTIKICLAVAVVIELANAVQISKDSRKKVQKLSKAQTVSDGHKKSLVAGLSKKSNYYRRQAQGSCHTEEFQCHDGACIPGIWQCDSAHDCIDHSDEFNCVADCSGAHQFHCHNGNCVPSSFYCDGDNDCGDLSDEQDCHLVPCTDTEVRCDNHICIEASSVCDGFDNCRSGWDEFNCTCTNEQFQCDDLSKCVYHFSRCDGSKDCKDGSDEINCVCDPDDQFQCTSGRCIPITWRCDRDNDCGDMSDELGCPTLHPDVCANVLSVMSCALMNETARPMCSNYHDAHKYCRQFCNVCNDPIILG
ncbi:sortilin-related receptor [Biomphalaria pfeifferi]|uniref:Sortilin-related receptor n=1 Tax=Biomphalaria pfeifferi TaxID=112525 RepID=A0AAD8EWT4_BIOPF|nr:sortilin-related receptor [Biomphalaria pfeifferi]